MASRFPAALAVLAALLLAGCSLFGSDAGPERGLSFNLLPEPLPSCADPAFAPNCGLAYEGTLTADSVYRLGPSTWPRRLVFDDGAQRFDLLEVQDLEMPFEVGRTYRTRVDLVPTTIIGYGAFEVWDADGLVLFATTELEAGAPINPSPPAGWSVSMEPGGYGSHALGCEVRSTPQVLVVEHGGRRVRLVQGQTKRLGAYRVTALVAEEVDYARVDCLDYAAPELSYVIARTAD